MKQYRSGKRLIHFWRKPEGDPDPVYGMWVKQITLTTECYGTPSILCNNVGEPNLEVVYRDMTRKAIKHIWRRAGTNSWQEDGTALPLMDRSGNRYEVISDPDMTQTADGHIHVAALVRNVYGFDNMTYWVRQAHSTET